MRYRTFKDACRGGALAAAVVLACVADGASAAPIYGVTSDNTLFTFDSANPGAILSGKAITNLFYADADESIRTIDFRPKTNELYAMSSVGQLYTVNQKTAVLTRIGGPVDVDGTSFGMDFDPTTDVIRIVSNTDKNYLVNPDTGVLISSGPSLSYAPGDLSAGVNPNIVGLAYTNGYPGANPAPSTQLYGYDASSGKIVKIDGSTGVMNSVGFLSYGTDTAGFDILSNAPGDNVGIAAVVPFGGGISYFSQFDLTNLSGTTAKIGGGLLVTDIAVPEPGTLSLLGAAAAAGTLLRRRRNSR